MESRSPRLMFLGRRGAGKSSLLNAICGEKLATVGSVVSETGKPTWYDVKTGRGDLRILDTRGLGDRTLPGSALDQIKETVRAEIPDAILFLCKAKEVDSRIREDAEDVAKIQRFISDEHGYEPPVAGIATQVDEIDPKRIEPPYNDEEKQRNIHTAVQMIEAALKGSGITAMRVIPVSAYAEYKDGKRVYDNYWNIDTLVDYLHDVFPEEAQLRWARIAAVRSVQVKMARTIVAATATICAAIGATPIPVADIVPITSAQVGMIVVIGYISGRELSYASAHEFLAAIGVNVGAAFVLREAARALAKLFVGPGNVVSGGVAFAGTWAIGEAAIAHFIKGKPIEEVKRVYRETKRKKEEEAPDGGQ